MSTSELPDTAIRKLFCDKARPFNVTNDELMLELEARRLILFKKYFFDHWKWLQVTQTCCI